MRMQRVSSFGFRASRMGRRAFSLLEVLIATLILGIGLIMVAAIFPVGATWSRQGAEETIAQNLALNAVSIIKTKYSPTGSASLFIPAAAPTDAHDAYYSAGKWMVGGAVLPAAPSERVFSLPNFGTVVPVSERTYAVGTDQPFPVPAAAALNRAKGAQYFWTALMKVPDDNSTTVALYILVFRRGDAAQVFTTAGGTGSMPSGPPSPATDVRSGAVSLDDCRNAGSTSEQISGSGFTPSVWLSAYSGGALVGADVKYAWPHMGSFGIGASSGTVFRQVVNIAANSTNPGAMPSLLLSGQANGNAAPNEKIITAAPPDGWPDSPLIYIYQTQLSF